MKLNLLPTYVGKGKQMTLAVVFGVMLIAASAGVTMVMISDANHQLAKVKEQAQQYEKPVDAAIEYAAKAQPIIDQVKDVVRNTNLAVAMQEHNKVYPDFYNKILPTIPDFFRVTAIQANPANANDPTAVNLRMTGVLKTEEQYRDLMLALLRIKGAQTVTRTGFTPKFSVLSGVSKDNPNPKAPPPGEAALPQDPLERLDALIARGRPQRSSPARGYGDEPGERGPMPDYQQVTVSVVLKDPEYQLMTPNPTQTLGVGGGRGGGVGGGARGRRGGGGGG